MSESKFKANNWLNKNSSALDSVQVKSRTSGFEDLYAREKELNEENFCPLGFFVPGWNGENLISKEILKFEKVINELVIDAKNQFLNTERFSKTQKSLIYNEFIKFLNNQKHEQVKIKDLDDFWEQVAFKNYSPFKNILENFIESYCKRLVVVYLLKVRFILTLCSHTNINFSISSLINPSSFLSKVFKKGGTLEVESEALQQNQYSWYRPSENFHNLICQISEFLVTLKQSQIIKSLSIKSTNYSHSLSHGAFGELLSRLFINFPKWIESDEKNFFPFTAVNTEKENFQVLDCKFEGDYLSSISQAYWIAQNYFLGQKKWDTIMAPHFFSENYNEGCFLKLCHELQFMIFLIHIAKEETLDPIQFIGKTYRKKKESSEQSNRQMSIFENTDEKVKKNAYKRILINLSQLPKKNPHHFLIQKVNKSLDSLHKDGFLYVLSNQNLFVPSQSEKVEQLLSKVKLETFINMEPLKGRGEIPQHLYIFTLRKDLSLNNHIHKETVSTFRWSGELNQFQEMKGFVEEFRSFLIEKGPNLKSMYRKELRDENSFEYYQDAILDGKFLNSGLTDSDNITHPNFFKNLTKSCYPLDYFFIIDSINNNDVKNAPTSDLLGIKFKQYDSFPYVLIINYSSTKNIKVEIINSSSLRAKQDQYGNAFFQYFGITPKIKDLDLDIFREFFNDKIGHQVIQLSLSGGMRKLKSKLKSLLVPKFFINTNYPTLINDEYLNTLQLNEEEILQRDPEELKNKYFSAISNIQNLSKTYPSFAIQNLSNSKSFLLKAIDSFQGQRGQMNDIPFNNPVLKKPLLSLKSTALNQGHPDIYIDFLSTDMNSLNGKIEKIESKTEDNKTFIEIYSSGTPCVRLYTDDVLCAFLSFILNNTIGHNLFQILNLIKVPRSNELSQIISDYQKRVTSLIDVKEKCSNVIAETFRIQIINGNSHVI